MKFKLVEALLTEGKNIDRTWDQYKNKVIPEIKKIFPNDFRDFSDQMISNWDNAPEIEDQQKVEEIAKDLWERVMTIDPTYKMGQSTTGDYGIWITNMLSKGDLEGYARLNQLGKVIKDFIQKKSNLTKKDINQYKSIDELQSILDKTQLTDRQKERQLRNAYGDSKLIYSDNSWVVYQVTSYASACTLGKGTRWCTAYSDNDEYYQDYAKSGNLYVIINRQDQTEKYQLFVPEESKECNHLKVEMHDKDDGDMHGNTNRFIDVDEFLGLDKVTDGLRDFLERVGIHKEVTMPENAEVLAVMEITGQTAESAREDIESGNTYVLLGIDNDEEFGREEVQAYGGIDEGMESYVDWEGLGCDCIIDDYDGNVDKAMEDFGVSPEQFDYDAVIQKEGMNKGAPVEFLQDVGRDYWYRTDDTVIEPYFDYAGFGYDQREWRNGSYSRYGLVLFE